MKTIRIQNLKIGDKLPDTKKSEFGQFINMIISSIKITKNGRFNILYTYTYISSNGEKIDGIRKYSNSAILGSNKVDIEI